MWTERKPAGDVEKKWACCASDDNGSNLIAGVYVGRLYTSVDGGVTWTERQPGGDADKNWACCASDADGSFLIAGEYGGRLYTSNDSGATWTERKPAGDVNKSWSACASDNDGSNLIVVATAGRVYTSDDSGVTWTERKPSGDVNRDWKCCASDDDGSNLIVGQDAGPGGRLYTSDDGGVNWTERQPAGDVDRNWRACASDTDGSNLIAGALTSRLYTSDDYGATWTERQPAGDVDEEWLSCASDSDGSNLIVGASPGRLYTSWDSGVTWTERQLAGNMDKYWGACASDSDGTNLIVGGGVVGGTFFERLYTSDDSGECDDQTTKHRPLFGGISGMLRGGTYATLGVIVRDSQDEKLVVLTNNHCAGTLYDPDYKTPDSGSILTTGISMLQPSPDDGGTDADIFGVVKRAVAIQFGTDSDQDNKVDATIATTEIDDTDTPINFLDEGPFPFLGLANVVLTEGIYVIGRTGGFITPAYATVTSKNTGATVLFGADADQNKAVYTNQIQIEGIYATSIFKAGDSGSVVLVKRGSEYKIIGLLFAASADGKTALVNPIEDVTTLLEIESWDGGIVVAGNMDANVTVNDKTYTRVGSTIDDITHVVP